MTSGHEKAPRDADPGLQPERTALAWRRTLLTLIVADFFIWRSWLTALSRQTGEPAERTLGLGLAAGASAAATMVIAVCVLIRAQDLRHQNAAPSVLLLRSAAAAVLVLGASVAACVVLSA